MPESAARVRAQLGATARTGAGTGACLDEVDAALVGGSAEAGHVADDAAAQRKERGVAV